MVRLRSLTCWIILGSLTLSGCTTSSPPTTPKSSNISSKSTNSTSTKQVTASAKEGYFEDYPDVPKVDIMTEVDGIKIPRVKASASTMELTGAVAADVNNPLGKKPSQPAKGDTLTVRFGAEPKVLNPITENSAVMRYIMYYVNEQLYRRDWETFEYKPHLAKQSIVEDSIKLSPDYPGRERRVAIEGKPAQASLEIDYEIPAAKEGKPAESPKVVINTSDKDGKPVGRCWVGIYPVGRIVGVAVTGIHQWSDDQGKLTISNLPTGKYTVKTGDEVFGKTKLHDDGSVTVTAGTAENPLHDPLTLKKGEHQEVHVGTYMTFYLRDDVKWSDGAPFTSKDIVFEHALLNNEFVDGDSIRVYYSDLIECQALAPYTIRMRYRQQYFRSAEFLNEITSYIAPFHFFEAIFKEQNRELTLERLTPTEEAAQKKISAHGQEFGKFFNTDKRYNNLPIGVGKYYIDKWEHKDRVELVRNPHYFDASKAGYVDRIIVKFIPDQVTSLNAMKAGEIDFFYDMTAEHYFEAWPTLGQETRDTYIKAEWFSPQFAYVGWNQLMNPLKDRRVRVALSLLFDRKEFIEKKMHGSAVMVSGTEYIFGPAYDQDVAPLGYDPDTAAELLTAAGWVDSDNDGILDKNGEKLQITLRLAQGRKLYVQMCEVLQKNCKSAGIDLQIQEMEWASYIEKWRAKECDAAQMRWVMEPENDPFQIWHSSEGAREKRGSNAISFRNAKADELIELMRVTLDVPKRRRIQQSFHRLIDSEQPYSFLWAPKELGAYHKRFRNVKWYRLRPGFDLSEWYVPKDEQLHR